jgi:CDP-diglyceride synthetase
MVEVSGAGDEPKKGNRMNFHWGAIPEDDIELDESWSSIKEPGPIGMQLIATPIALVLGAIFVFLWTKVSPLEPISVTKAYLPLLGLAIAASFPLLILVHEFLHAAAHPHFGLRSASIIGVWPTKLLIYAHYCGEMSRNRFLLVFAMPFLVISVLPLAVAWSGIFSPTVAFVLAWFSSWNALFASGDIFGIALIYCQIPGKSLVRNKGWRTYWKPVQEQPSSPDL